VNVAAAVAVAGVRVAMPLAVYVGLTNVPVPATVAALRAAIPVAV